MFQVLARFLFGRSKTPLGLPSCFVFLVILLSAFFVQPLLAQTLANGQLFTNGLSIVDSPAPQSTFQAGSNLDIAVEVSGNGKLPLSASVPGNSGDNGYDGLDLYLVSSQTNTNLTVSFNSSILKQESGSAVKHLNWPIPSCIAAGQYNLTFYECARINGQFFYTITPIGVQINNLDQSGDSGPCTADENTLQQQPQLCSPPLRSPFLPIVGQQSSAQPDNPKSSGFLTSRSDSSTPTPASGITTITISSGALVPMTFSPTATVTQIASTSTVTIVIVSLQTQTLTTMQGQSSTFATIETSSTTTTTFMRGGGHSGSSNNAGFQPVNAAPLCHCHSFASLLVLTITVLIFGIY